MAVITAKGKTRYGQMDVKITGEHAIESIESSEDYVADFFRERIAAADGYMANGYHPEQNTMLQAYAYCTTIFNWQDIHVDGELEQMESEEGVIY